MKKIFISRNLSETSILKQELQEPDFHLLAFSLIEFSPISFDSPPSSDWIFFYSRKAVRFFLHGIKDHGYQQRDPKIAVMGEGTATYLLAQGLQADFIGNGKPEETAQAFLAQAKGQSVLFPRAYNSKQSIQKLLGNEIKPIDLVVYKNEPKSEFEIPVCDILVFTSPLNVQAYCSKYLLNPGQQIVAIGDTTRSTLTNLGVKKVEIPTVTSEQGLVELIKGN